MVYAITSLPADRLSADTLLGLSRGHWGIENTLFHVRDVTFREDHCRVRTAAALRDLASTRDFVLGTIRRLGQQPRPSREYLAENKAEAIQTVTGSR